MKVLKEPEGLGLDVLDLVRALQGRLKELLPKWEPQLFSQQPSKLPGRQVDPLRAHLRREHPEAGRGRGFQLSFFVGRGLFFQELRG